MPHEPQSGPIIFKASGVSFSTVHKARLGCGLGLLALYIRTIEHVYRHCPNIDRSVSDKPGIEEEPEATVRREVHFRTPELIEGCHRIAFSSPDRFQINTTSSYIINVLPHTQEFNIQCRATRSCPYCLPHRRGRKVGTVAGMSEMSPTEAKGPHSPKSYKKQLLTESTLLPRT